MHPPRPEITAFCEAVETLIATVLPKSPLPNDELAIIRVYMQTLKTKVLGIPSEKTPADQ